MAMVSRKARNIASLPSPSLAPPAPQGPVYCTARASSLRPPLPYQNDYVAPAVAGAAFAACVEATLVHLLVVVVLLLDDTAKGAASRRSSTESGPADASAADSAVQTLPLFPYHFAARPLLMYSFSSANPPPPALFRYSAIPSPLPAAAAGPPPPVKCKPQL